MATSSQALTSPSKFATCVAVLLTGLSAGFFSTYQYSVTRALSFVDDSVYVATFQAINATVRSAEFGVILFGSLPAIVLAILLNRTNRSVLFLMVGALLTYAIMLAITFSVHIPLNEALAVADLSSPNATTGARTVFESQWNDMHLIRTCFVLVSFVLTIWALACSAITPRTR